MTDHAPGYGPLMVRQAPENELHRTLSRLGLTKTQQALTMQALRNYDLVYDPRAGKPKDIDKAALARARMYLLHQARAARDCGDVELLRSRFRTIHRWTAHLDGGYPSHMRLMVYYAAKDLEAFFASIESRYAHLYEAGLPSRVIALEDKVLKNEINQHYYEARAARDYDAQYQA